MIYLPGYFSIIALTSQFTSMVIKEAILMSRTNTLQYLLGIKCKFKAVHYLVTVGDIIGYYTNRHLTVHVKQLYIITFSMTGTQEYGLGS